MGHNVKHLVLFVDDDGDITFAGSSNLAQGLMNDVDLHNSLKINLTESSVLPGGDQHCRSVSFPRLPCSPFSKQWKGTEMIRGALNELLKASGYTRSGKAITRKILNYTQYI